ncbi:LamB/YcsF family protein [Roseococcus sp. YIM B11640]|uniref:LamB/YcsF family protein n=1 Tax=Roseococcus sp. YIM B11640 TaxID=3133973 RepID=UPI003C7D6C64
MPVVNINADIGESFGTWHKGNDPAVMPLINSANIACGMSAGDPTVMHETVALALKNGVSIGAHPGYNDIWGFGRRAMKMNPRDIEYMVAYQIGALMGIAAMHGAKVTHVKPHGALHNVGIVDPDVAEAMARGVKGVDRDLIYVGLAHSEIEKAAHHHGLRFAVEGYIDRMYDEDGNITSRFNADAVHKDPARAAAQAVAMVVDKVILTREGKRIPVEVHSLCLHADEPTAEAVGRATREALLAAGVELKTLPEMGL